MIEIIDMESDWVLRCETYTGLVDKPWLMQIVQEFSLVLYRSMMGD